MPDSPLEASEVITTLREDEMAELERCEALIETGREVFLRVGRALMTIRDDRLYRDRYGTFENYCREKWELDRSHAYRFIAAAEVMGSLSPIGDRLALPKNEAQTRPLARLEPERRIEAWKEAITLAGDGEVTARHVASAAKAICPPPPKKAASASRVTSRSNIVLEALMPSADAIALVDRITEKVAAGDTKTALALLSRLRAALGEK
jgi:hypothetical protein